MEDDLKNVQGSLGLVLEINGRHRRGKGGKQADVMVHTGKGWGSGGSNLSL